jgi:hypothetical protein
VRGASSRSGPHTETLALVRPGRRPLSRPAWRTEGSRRFRSDFSAIEQIAFHCDGYWCSGSRKRAAFSDLKRYLCLFGMAPRSQHKTSASTKPGGSRRPEPGELVANRPPKRAESWQIIDPRRMLS